MSKELIKAARDWATNKVKLDGGMSDEVILVRNLCNELEKALPLILAAKLADVKVEPPK